MYLHKLKKKTVGHLWCVLKNHCCYWGGIRVRVIVVWLGL